MAIATDVDEKIELFLKLVSQKVRIFQVYLFGSSTTGKRHEWSDIDLAIVSPDFTGDSFEDSKMLVPFILEVDPAIEVHPFIPDDFTSDNPFVKEILDRGIKIH